MQCLCCGKPTEVPDMVMRIENCDEAVSLMTAHGVWQKTPAKHM